MKERKSMDTSPHESRLVEANGIHLHYLDWGGDGPILLFLAGLGCNAHIFDTFAPRFTDSFHVMALTRRGHGESDHPNAGYDIDSLTEDIHQFLVSMRIDQVILAGHSLAGLELTRFAVLHPGKVMGLVYLDAAYDYTTPACRDLDTKYPQGIQPPGLNDTFYSRAPYFAMIKNAFPALAAIWDEAMDAQSQHEILQEPDGKIVDRMSEQIFTAIKDMTHTYSPENGKITAPTLAIYTLDSGQYYASADWMTEEQKTRLIQFQDEVRDAWARADMETFRRAVPHAHIVVIPQGHHYVFIKSADRVYVEMSAFLKSITTGLHAPAHGTPAAPPGVI
jgi:pimeloyl-ACP methyl ester carboxylesterase